MEPSQENTKLIKVIQKTLIIIGHVIIGLVLLANFIQIVTPDLGLVDFIATLAGVLLICASFLFNLPKVRAFISRKAPEKTPVDTPVFAKDKIIPLEIVRWVSWGVGLAYLVVSMADIVEYQLYENVDAWVGLVLAAALGVFGVLVYLPGIKKAIYWVFNLPDPASKDAEASQSKWAGVLRGFVCCLLGIIGLCLLGWAIYLTTNQVFRATLVEPRFVVRLFRALVLGYVVLLILRIPNIIEKIKAWKNEDATVMQSIWRGIRIPFFIGIGIIVLCIGAEVGARIAFREQMKAYDGDIFSEARTENLFTHDEVTSETRQAYNIDHPDGIEYYYSADYSGKYFNSKDGFRLTVAQPENYQNTIYMIGAQYVHSLDTPDAYTIPSYLQVMMNEKYGDDYRVVNWGTFMHSCESYYHKIQNLEVDNGDMVLLVMGTADISRLYMHDLYDWFWPVVGVSNQAEISKKINQVDDPWGNMAKTGISSQPSAFLRYVVQPNLPYKPENYKTVNEFKFALDSTVSTCVAVIKQSEDLLAQKGATLAVFIEPNLYTLGNPTEREVVLLNITDNPYISPYGADNVSKQFIEGLLSHQAELSDQNINLFDLTSAFDDRTNSEEIFHNWNSINEIGNQILAEKIFNILLTLLP